MHLGLLLGISMNSLTKKLLTLGTSAIIAVTGGYLISPWEGMENYAYKDIVGVATICFGETKGVKMGDYRTDEQCEESLSKELAVYNQAMKKHVKVELKPYEEVAYTSFVWNLGETNFKNSTLLKKLNQGDHEGACNELLKWNKVTVSYKEVAVYTKRGEQCVDLGSGKFSCTVKGLTNRRLGENKVCLGKDQQVNEALEALERAKTPPEASEKEKEGVSEVVPIKDVVEPLKPSELAVQPKVPEGCKIKFLGICFKRS